MRQANMTKNKKTFISRGLEPLAPRRQELYNVAMKADDKARVWRFFSLFSDYAGSGYRQAEAFPDFSDGPLFPTSRRVKAVPTSKALAPAAKPLGESGPILPRSGDSIHLIASEVNDCHACRLCEKRQKAVPGIGSAAPLVMVVGEGPGADEDAQGLPFVGPAGKLLDKMLAAIDLSRDSNVFIANVVKCRPPMNRDPEVDEQESCAPFLLRQIGLLRPSYILSLGRVATHALLGCKDPITRIHGRFFDFHGIALMPSYHPSALLRDESLKRPAWEDLKTLREHINAQG